MLATMITDNRRIVIDSFDKRTRKGEVDSNELEQLFPSSFILDGLQGRVWLLTEGLAFSCVMSPSQRSHLIPTMSQEEYENEKAKWLFKTRESVVR